MSQRFLILLVLAKLGPACAPACPDGGSAVHDRRATRTLCLAGSTGDGTYAESGFTTMAAAVCGDGMVDPGEGCDDWNEVDDDACPSGAVGRCQWEAKCGDGIVWPGMEECDDGNAAQGDGCEPDCTVTPSPSVCGNGIMEAGEGCDDGNADEADGCPSGAVGKCKAAASCGDGFVRMGMEGCDDGNAVETDGCPSGAVGQCFALASCGDGFVWMGMEVCDDGNAVETDGCPSGMAGQCLAVATCGDGFVEAGVEDCDDKNGDDFDECSNACAAPRWVFVTSVGYKGDLDMVGKPVGNLKGLALADARCQGLAEAAKVKLPGKYKAWLSDATGSPSNRFETGFGGYYRLPSKDFPAVAGGWSGLTSGTLLHAINSDESGALVEEGVWTNTKVDGTPVSVDLDCAGWTSKVADMANTSIIGVSSETNESWTELFPNPCSGTLRLYCFQDSR